MWVCVCVCCLVPPVEQSLYSMAHGHRILAVGCWLLAAGSWLTKELYCGRIGYTHASE